MSQVILAYIPVLHQGYLQLFKQYSDAKKLHLIDEKLAAKFTPVHKEIRALDQNLIKQAIESWQLFDSVTIADEKDLTKLNSQKAEVIIPDETVTREIAEKFLPHCPITKSSIFLRWDSVSATKQTEPSPDFEVSDDEVTKKFMDVSTNEGNKSSDWWRQVGAVAVRDNKIIAQTHNTHLPSEQQPYIEGDPRAHFHKGDHIDLTTAIHAEAKLIAEAAAQGLSLTDSEMYVTDFPRPNCAKLIAHAGVKKVYGMLDGERVLKTAEIEIFQVK